MYVQQNDANHPAVAKTNLLNVAEAISSESANRFTLVNNIDIAQVQASLANNRQASVVSTLETDIVNSLFIGSNPELTGPGKESLLKAHSYRKESYINDTIDLLQAKYPELQRADINALLGTPVVPGELSSPERMQEDSALIQEFLKPGARRRRNVNRYAAALNRAIHRAHQGILNDPPNLTNAAKQYLKVVDTQNREGHTYFENRADHQRELVAAERTLIKAIEAHRSGTPAVAPTDGYVAADAAINDYVNRVINPRTPAHGAPATDNFAADFKALMLQEYPQIINQTAWNEIENTVQEFNNMTTKERQLLAEEYSAIRNKPSHTITNEELSTLAKGAVAFRHALSEQLSQLDHGKQCVDACNALILWSQAKKLDPDLESQVYLNNHFMDRVREGIANELGIDIDRTTLESFQGSPELQELLKLSEENIRQRFLHIINSGDPKPLRLTQAEQLVVAAAIERTNQHIVAKQPAIRLERMENAVNGYIADLKNGSAPGRLLYPFADAEKRLKEVLMSGFEAQGKGDLATRVITKEGPRSKSSSVHRMSKLQLGNAIEQLRTQEFGRLGTGYRAIRKLKHNVMGKNLRPITGGVFPPTRLARNTAGHTWQSVSGEKGRDALLRTDGRVIDEFIRRALKNRDDVKSTEPASKDGLYGRAPDFLSTTSLSTPDEPFKLRKKTRPGVLNAAVPDPRSRRVSLGAAIVQKPQALINSLNRAFQASAINAVLTLEEKLWPQGIFNQSKSGPFLSTAIEALKKADPNITHEMLFPNRYVNPYATKAQPKELAQSYLKVMMRQKEVERQEYGNTDGNMKPSDMEPTDIDYVNAGKFLLLMEKNIQQQEKLQKVRTEISHSKQSSFEPNKSLIEQVNNLIKDGRDLRTLNPSDQKLLKAELSAQVDWSGFDLEGITKLCSAPLQNWINQHKSQYGSDPTLSEQASLFLARLGTAFDAIHPNPNEYG